MSNNDNAIARSGEAIQPALSTSAGRGAGLAWGAIGVVAFSFTLPATKFAVQSIDGIIVGLGRALVAAACAGLLLVVAREPWPKAAQWRRLALVALGVVIGFPLLTALALRSVPSSHGAILVGLLPAATAAMAVLRAGERPSVGFWLSTALGVATVIAFAAVDGLGELHLSDGLLVAAVVLAALGYAEGGALAREIGSWQVICWALLLAVTPCVVCLVLVPRAPMGPPTLPAVLGFAYVSLISMFLGFFAWYRGLALGGIARIGQLQLLQPTLTLLWGHLLLGEALTSLHLVAAAAVLGSVSLSLRLRVSRRGA